MLSPTGLLLLHTTEETPKIDNLFFSSPEEKSELTCSIVPEESTFESDTLEQQAELKLQHPQPSSLPQATRVSENLTSKG